MVQAEQEDERSPDEEQTISEAEAIEKVGPVAERFIARRIAAGELIQELGESPDRFRYRVVNSDSLAIAELGNLPHGDVVLYGRVLAERVRKEVERRRVTSE